MMLNFLVIVVIIAVAAWISNGLLNLDRALSAARARIRASNDSVARLEEALEKVRRESDKITVELEELDKEEIEWRVKNKESQRRLAEIQSKTRQRLLIISDRRDPGDKEWIVTVANPQISEIDASHPLGQEWQRGREYLVWATGEREAGQRTLRRFNARPGFVIRSVAEASDGVYAAPAHKKG